MNRPTLLLLSLLFLASPTLSAPATLPTTRPYALAPDKPLNPTQTTVEATQTYTRLRVEFNGINNDRVPAFLYIPNDNKPKHPAVLLQYGSGGNKNTNYIVILGQQFAARGFVVLTIDIPNKGDRKGKDPAANLLDRRIPETLGDYGRATDYLLTRPEVDPDRLSFVGLSWGAITGIIYVAHDPRIKVMASIVGGGNFLGWLPNVSDEAKKAAQSTDPYYHVHLIAPRPLLLLNVTKDQLIPRFCSESLHKAAGDHAKKIWLDTDHIFSGLDRLSIGQTVIDFVQENLPSR